MVIDQFLMGLPKEKFPIACYLTHAHEDHAGTAYFIIKKFNIPVYCPPQSVSLLKTGWDYKEYRQMTWGDMGFTGFDAIPFETPIKTPNGFVFDALPMPGHSPDLHGFIEKRQGWAFLGDMMLPQYQMLFGQTCEIQEDIQVIAESLEKLYVSTEGIENLQMFVSGKGAYVGREVIRIRLEEIYDLHKKVHEANAKLEPDMKPTRKMRKLLQELFGGESFFGGMTAGELSRANMIESCLKWPLA